MANEESNLPVEEPEEVCDGCSDPGILTRTGDNNRVCESCLEDEYMLCDKCEEYFSSLTKTQDYTEVCPDCLEEYYNKCPTCNEYVEEALSSTTTGHACDKCIEYDFAWCDCCSRYCPNDDMTAAEDELVCSTCLDRHYTTCDGCDEHFRETTRTVNDLFVCDSCLQNDYIRCESCDEYYPDNTDCPSCPTDNLLPYSTNVVTRLATFPKEHDRFWLGLELETDTDECSDDTADVVDAVLKRLGSDLFVAKRDGSVTGPEFVSAPAPLSVFRERFKNMNWPCGLRSWDGDNCGIHVHISLDYFGEAHLSRFIGFINDEAHRSQIVKFAGRNSSWAKFLGADEIEAQSAPCKPLKALKDKAGRYHAVNLPSDKPTAEVRIFKGTLRVERILADLEFVAAVARFTAHDRDMSWEAFCSFTRLSSEYGNLMAVLKDKGIFRPVVVKSVPQITNLSEGIFTLAA